MSYHKTVDPREFLVGKDLPGLVHKPRSVGPTFTEPARTLAPALPYDYAASAWNRGGLARMLATNNHMRRMMFPFEIRLTVLSQFVGYAARLQP